MAFALCLWAALGGASASVDQELKALSAFIGRKSPIGVPGHRIVTTVERLDHSGMQFRISFTDGLTPTTEFRLDWKTLKGIKVLTAQGIHELLLVVSPQSKVMRRSGQVAWQSVGGPYSSIPMPFAAESDARGAAVMVFKICKELGYRVPMLANPSIDDQLLDFKRFIITRAQKSTNRGKYSTSVERIDRQGIEFTEHFEDALSFRVSWAEVWQMVVWDRHGSSALVLYVPRGSKIQKLGGQKDWWAPKDPEPLAFIFFPRLGDAIEAEYLLAEIFTGLHFKARVVPQTTKLP